MNLTTEGFTINDEDGNIKWSTPRLNSKVSAFELSERGLFLLDRLNQTLWESFQSPTDVVVIGQPLPAGTTLNGSVSDNDLSTANYRLRIISYDVMLQWNGRTYWQLSMDANAQKKSKYPVEYIMINGTGLYLLGRNGTAVVTELTLSSRSTFRIGKLDYLGRLTLCNFSGKDWKQESVFPADNCRVPFVCGGIGLCTSGSVCSCPSNFRSVSENSTDCVPINSSYNFPDSCSSNNNGTKANSTCVFHI